MTPAPTKTKIAVIGDASGQWHIKIVLIAPISQALATRLRASGQIDCGKRQQWVPIEVEKLSDSVVERLMRLGHLEAGAETLRYDSREEATQAAQEMAQDPIFEFIAIDRTIPTV